MKSINVRKLVALAVGAGLVLSPVGAAQVFADDTLPTSKDWYLNSAIIVGSNAKPADVVWAGNIAAAIGQLAFTETTTTVGATGEGVKVRLRLPAGVTTVGGQGYDDKAPFDFTATEWSNVTYAQSKIPSLKDSELEEFSFREKGTTDAYEDADARIDEEFNITADAKMDAVQGSDTAELRLTTTATTGLRYYVKITDFLEQELNTAVPTTDTTYEFRNFMIPILGDTFEIKEMKVDAAADDIDTIKIVRNAGYRVLSEGESVTVGDYVVKVKAVGKSGDQGSAVLELYEGDTKVAEEIVYDGETTDFGGRLSSPVKLNKVIETSQGNMAELYLSAEEITLTNGLDKEFGADGWRIKFTTADTDASGLVDEITFEVYYDGDNADTWLSFETGAKIGEAITFPGGGNYGLLFKGFENKPKKEVKFEGSRIYFVDSEGTQRDAMLFKEIPTGSVAQYDADTDTFNLTNLIDGRNAKVYVDFADGTVGADVSAVIKVDLDRDGDIDAQSATIDVDAAGASPVWVSGDVQFDTFTYHFMLKIAYTDNNTPNDENLLEAKVFFKASDGTVGWTASEDVPYYVVMLPDGADADNLPDGWKVQVNYDGGAAEDAFTVPFDGADVELDFGSNGFDVTVYPNLNATTYNIDADPENDESAPENAWTKGGVEIMVESSNTVKAYVPTTAAELIMFVGQLPTEVSTEGQVITLGEGESAVIGGTEVTVEGIEGVEATVTTMERVELPDQITFLDNEDYDAYDNLIVVGGYYVNAVVQQMATEIPELVETVAAEGDYIVKKYTWNGKDVIVVFGYTAEDTGKAAMRFVRWIKENVA